MGKYTIMMGCGHEDTVTLFGNSEERKRKIEYFKESGLCKECYKIKMREQEKSKGLIFNISALPYIDENDGSILFYIWFSGDTMPNKEKIKSLGYYWGENEAADDWYSIKRPQMTWNKTVKECDLQGEISKAESIGAKRTEIDDGLFASIHYKIALNRQKKWKEIIKKIASIPKPKTPNILIGHRWNHKIYGKPGNFSVYLDNDKVTITDIEANEIRQYLKDKEEYKEKVYEIQKS